jgi:hypothetical protein
VLKAFVENILLYPNNNFLVTDFFVHIKKIAIVEVVLEVVRKLSRQKTQLLHVSIIMLFSYWQIKWTVLSF